VVARRVRAFDPFPGAQSALGAEVIKVWAAVAEPGEGGEPGRILAVDEQGVCVQCGQGRLRLTVLQRAGGKRLPVADFLRGFPLAPGAVLGTPA
jgi:methionyl-tRNA formyltransferase